MSIKAVKTNLIFLFYFASAVERQEIYFVFDVDFLALRTFMVDGKSQFKQIYCFK